MTKRIHYNEVSIPNIPRLNLHKGTLIPDIDDYIPYIVTMNLYTSNGFWFSKVVFSMYLLSEWTYMLLTRLH